AMFNVQSKSRNGAVIEYRSDLKEAARLNFFDAWMSEVSFPALDSSSKEMAKISVKLAPGRTTRKTVSSTASLPAARIQSRWLASNFRLAVEGVDCSRVSRVGAITVRQVFTEVPAAALRDYQKQSASLEVPNLSWFCRRRAHRPSRSGIRAS